MKISLPALLITFFLASDVRAGTELPQGPAANPPVSGQDVWWSRILSYGWVPAVDGNISIGKLGAPVEISMADTLDNLDMAYMGTFELGRGKASVGIDIIYSKSSESISGDGTPFDSFFFKEKQWELTPFAAYRLIETESYRMDLYGGARITLIEADLTARFVGKGQITAGRNLNIVDPIIGIRGQSDLNDKFFFRYGADIGGFGLDSDFHWQASAAFGWNLNRNTSIGIGYRALGIDYKKDSFSLDIVSHGPAIGLEMRW